MSEADLDFGLFDADNPRSLVNIVPEGIRDAMLRVHQEDLLLDDRALRKKVKPSDHLNRLRLNFWLEFFRAQEKQAKMLLGNIVHGISSRDYLYGAVLGDPLKTAWLISPPTDVAVVQMDIMHASLDRLAAITRKDPYIVKEIIKKDGTIERTKRLDIAAIAEIRKVAEMMMDRVQGSVIQRVAIKQQTSVEKQAELYGDDALTALAGQLESLKKALPPAVEAEVVENE